MLWMVFKGVFPQARLLNLGTSCCYTDILFVIPSDMQQDILSQISSSKKQKCFSLCSLKPESTHIPWISPCFTKANDYSWILHSKFNIAWYKELHFWGPAILFLSLAFSGFWNTSPVDTVCLHRISRNSTSRFLEGLCFIVYTYVSISCQKTFLYWKLLFWMLWTLHPLVELQELSKQIPGFMTMSQHMTQQNICME